MPLSACKTKTKTTASCRSHTRLQSTTSTKTTTITPEPSSTSSSSASLHMRRAQNTTRDRQLPGEKPLHETPIIFRWTQTCPSKHAPKSKARTGGGVCKSVIVTGSFDGWLHHRLHRKNTKEKGAIMVWETEIGVRPGVHSYKYLVDGRWKIDENSHVLVDADGVKVNRLVVDGVRNVGMMGADPGVRGRGLGFWGRGVNGGGGSGNGKNLCRSGSGKGLSRSGSSKDLSRSGSGSKGLSRSGSCTNVSRGGSGKGLSGSGSSKNLGGSGSNKKLGAHSSGNLKINGDGSKSDREGCYSKEVGADVMIDAADHDYGSNSIRKANGTKGISYHKKAAGKSGNVRKSLLQRMSSGFMRRLSVRSVSNDELDSGLNKPSTGGLLSLSSSSVRHSDTFHRKGRSTHDSDECDKENNGRSGFVKSSSWRTSMKNTPRNSASRGSSRHGMQIQVSRPTKVDEPQSVEEVERQAEGWRDMARHLQEDLKDPSGARELLVRAVEHREKHGRWCTFENAQTHVDLARSFSKSSKLTDAEFHLRIALRVYNQIEVRPGHLGDLLHYIGVVVDRQKRRTEAEELYKQALGVYKDGRLTGDNVDIALKNLSLCLKKQGRESEAEGFIRNYYGFGSTEKK